MRRKGTADIGTSSGISSFTIVPSSFMVYCRKEMVKVVVSVPVLTKLSSCICLEPSKTTRIGVISKLPCAYDELFMQELRVSTINMTLNISLCFIISYKQQLHQMYLSKFLLIDRSLPLALPRLQKYRPLKQEYHWFHRIRKLKLYEL